MSLQIRRGTAGELASIIPDSGEPIWTIDDKKLYVGDGSTMGGNLVSAGQDVSTTSNVTFNTVVVTNTATVAAIKFSDGSIQTTADTANPDQSLNTTSNVKFNSAVIATFLTATNIQATGVVDFNNLMYRGNYETFPINTSTANTSTFLVAQWDNSIRSTQKFMLQAIDVNSSPDKIHFQEISIVDDGTNQYKVEYGINTNAGQLGSYTVNAVGSTGYLLFTPNALVTASPNAFKIMGEQLSIRNA